MSKPYRTSDFLARRADAEAKAAKDVARAERLARDRADIERTLEAARANDSCRSRPRPSYGPSHQTAAHLRGSLFCGLKQTAPARRASYSNRGHDAHRPV